MQLTMRARWLGPLFFVASGVALAQEAPYPVFESDTIPAAEFKTRRAKLKAEMGPGSLGVFFTNPTRNRNNDVDFLFRGDSNFLYLTGFDEPDAALLLVPDGFDLAGFQDREGRI